MNDKIKLHALDPRGEEEKREAARKTLSNLYSEVYKANKRLENIDKKLKELEESIEFLLRSNSQ